MLELAVIKLLEDKKKKSLSAQMEHFWTELPDNSANLTRRRSQAATTCPSASTTISRVSFRLLRSARLIRLMRPDVKPFSEKWENRRKRRTSRFFGVLQP